MHRRSYLKTDIVREKLEIQEQTYLFAAISILSCCEGANLSDTCTMLMSALLQDAQPVDPSWSQPRPLQWSKCSSMSSLVVVKGLRLTSSSSSTPNSKQRLSNSSVAGHGSFDQRQLLRWIEWTYSIPDQVFPINLLYRLRRWAFWDVDWVERIFAETSQILFEAIVIVHPNLVCSWLRWNISHFSVVERTAVTTFFTANKTVTSW